MLAGASEDRTAPSLPATTMSRPTTGPTRRPSQSSSKSLFFDLRGSAHCALQLLTLGTFVGRADSRTQVMTLEENVQAFGLTYFGLKDKRQGIVHVSHFSRRRFHLAHTACSGHRP